MWKRLSDSGGRAPAGPAPALLDRLGPRVDVELRVELAHMCLDRVHRQEQLVPDLGGEVRFVGRKRSTASSAPSAVPQRVRRAAPPVRLHPAQQSRSTWRWAACAVRCVGWSRSRSRTPGTVRNRAAWPWGSARESAVSCCVSAASGRRVRWWASASSSQASMPVHVEHRSRSRVNRRDRGERFVGSPPRARCSRAARLHHTRRDSVHRASASRTTSVSPRPSRARSCQGRSRMPSTWGALSTSTRRSPSRNAAKASSKRPRAHGEQTLGVPESDAGRGLRSPGQDRIGALEPLLGLGEHAPVDQHRRETHVRRPRSGGGSSSPAAPRRDRPAEQLGLRLRCVR